MIGDGDNLAFVKGSRRSWMLERQSKCAADPDACFPLLWSLSPNLIDNAPQMMQWYYNVSYNTTHDYFVLPPSGHLYSYPGMMGADDQARYVTATERDCEIMSTSGSVHWEWFGTWSRAIANFIPQYAVNSIVQGLFPVNVPYMLPMAEGGWGHDHYKIIDESVVLFKPKEWRGTSCTPKWNCPTAQGLADEISGYEKVRLCTGRGHRKLRWSLAGVSPESCRRHGRTPTLPLSSFTTPRSRSFTLTLTFNPRPNAHAAHVHAYPCLGPHLHPHPHHQRRARSLTST